MHSVKKFKIAQRQLPRQKVEENSCRTPQTFRHVAGTNTTQYIEKIVMFEMVSQTHPVRIHIKLHPAKDAAQLPLLRAWRKSRLERLGECLHMHWGCLYLKVRYLNQSKDLEMRWMLWIGEACRRMLWLHSILSCIWCGVNLRWLVLFCVHLLLWNGFFDVGSRWKVFMVGKLTIGLTERICGPSWKKCVVCHILVKAVSRPKQAQLGKELAGCT